MSMIPKFVRVAAKLGARRGAWTGCRQASYDRRSVDLSTPPPAFFFDTHSCVKKLMEHGFSETEAESLTDLLATIISSQADVQHKTLVNKTQLEIVTQELLAQISSVKKDMAILERSEFSNLKHDTEKLGLSIKQLDTKIDVSIKQLDIKLADEVAKIKSGFVLDLNLERSRAKEDQAKIERDIGQLTNRIGLEVASMHTEIANIQAAFEAKRLDMVKYIAGTFLTAAGLIVSVGFISIRLLKS